MSPVSLVPTYHHRKNERRAEVKAAWFPTMSNRNRRHESRPMTIRGLGTTHYGIFTRVPFLQ
jgi:hypothetical protein